MQRQSELKLSTKLRQAFKIIGLKVNIEIGKLGLDQQYEYKQMIIVNPEGLWVGETNPVSNPSYKYDIYDPDGEQLGTYSNFDKMFESLVQFIINSRLQYRFGSSDIGEFPY